jgi:hypothetical protein
MTVDHEGKTPLYLQIAAILRGEIERGVYAPGRPVPSETQLMQRFEVARWPPARLSACSSPMAWWRSFPAAAPTSPSGRRAVGTL